MSIKFRRIYWVTEQFDDDGCSQVTGVYTSIPDLIDWGLGIRANCDKKKGFRFCLCELDSKSPPLVSFSSEGFGNVEEKLSTFVASGEMTHEEVVRLYEALNECK